MLRISEVHSQPNQTSRITAQKIKFSIKDFFSKCEKIFSFLRIWSHLLKKSLMEHFIFLCSEAEMPLIPSLGPTLFLE